MLTPKIFWYNGAMIEDRRAIEIKALPNQVFEHIETRLNKFPTFKFLETRPFLSLRMSLVDGFRTGMRVAFDRNFYQLIVKIWTKPLRLGDSMGPFRLTELKREEKYYFDLNSYFFRCETGYSFSRNQDKTILSFDLIAENPNLKEKIWWFFAKPFHVILANQALRIIKQEVESK